MDIESKILKEYYSKTGQDFQYLMQGASQYGAEFIFDELVPQALEKNKKIIWKDDPEDIHHFGLVVYELQPL